MERKSSAYLNSDDMFSTYAQKTYMENIPFELVTNGLSHPYHLDEFIFIFRDIGSIFHFSMKIVKANRIAPNGAILFAYVP